MNLSNSLTRSHVSFEVVFSTEVLVAVGTSEPLDTQVDLVEVVSNVVGRLEHLFTLSTRVFWEDL